MSSRMTRARPTQKPKKWPTSSTYKINVSPSNTLGVLSQFFAEFALCRLGISPMMPWSWRGAIISPGALPRCTSAGVQARVKGWRFWPRPFAAKIRPGPCRNGAPPWAAELPPIGGGSCPRRGPGPGAAPLVGEGVPRSGSPRATPLPWLLTFSPRQGKLTKNRNADFGITCYTKKFMV